MSSEWRPERARLFDLWLVPPAAAGMRARKDLAAGSQQAQSRSEMRIEKQADSAGRPAFHSASASLAVRTDSRGWTVAAAAREPAIGVAIECDGIATPPQRLHPAERQRLERMPPEERTAARKLLAAARRALAAALGIPPSGVWRAADLGPLLDGAQALRAGGWSMQRVPAPPGVYVFVAAPGWGWGYALRPGEPPEGAGPE